MFFPQSKCVFLTLKIVRSQQSNIVGGGTCLDASFKFSFGRCFTNCVWEKHLKVRSGKFEKIKNQDARKQMPVNIKLHAKARPTSAL